MSALTATPTLLVTGASGFVGACACRWFASRGSRVVAVHGPSRRHWRLKDDLPTSLEAVEVDLTSVEAVRALVRSVRPSVVVNCATYGAYSNQAEADRVYRVNFDAVRIMVGAVEELTGFRAFLQAGSSSEYGTNCTAPSEESATRPDSDYAVAKVAATAFLQFVAQKRRVPAWVLRLSSVYGPYEDSSRLVPRLLTLGRDKRFPPLANRRISRDFVYIDDVCKAFDHVIERSSTLPPGEIFNIGTGIKTTLEDIVACVRNLFAIEAEPAWGSMPDRAWDLPDWYSNPKKANDLLNWHGTTTLGEGLAITSRWMTEHPELVRAAEANVVTGGV